MFGSAEVSQREYAQVEGRKTIMLTLSPGLFGMLLSFCNKKREIFRWLGFQDKQIKSCLSFIVSEVESFSRLL